MILFIVGCQRSGTTLLKDIFEYDWQAKVYGELSPLSSKDKGKRRFRQLEEVKKIIDRNKARLIITKPLVESQNILNLLDYFPNSKSIWMFRHYRDVAKSNLEMFGDNNGIDDLRPVIKKEAHDWRYENMSAETFNIVSRYFKEDMNPYDAAALFWLVRNRIFLELNLAEHSRVMMVKYEDFCTYPQKVFQKIYDFMKVQYPGDKMIKKKISTDSIHKGKAIGLSSEVESLCDELYEKLNSIHNSKFR